jgi:hypothetical protein
MSNEEPGVQAWGTAHRQPSLFAARPVSAWLVIGALILFALFSIGLFFETIAPVADFWFQPVVAADSGAYWELSGVRSGSISTSSPSSEEHQVTGSSSFGPVLEAKLLRTDSGVLISNLMLLAFLLWMVGSMPEFDRATFTALLLLNPLLISAVITLNKEIFAITGVVAFVKYMKAQRFRALWLAVAVFISLGGRWQQAAIMMLLAAYESRISPIRGKRLTGIMLAVLLYTVLYTAVYQAAPVLIAGLLAQAQGGHTIWMLDQIQGHFGFPIVVLPKIAMNVMGYFITPGYFLSDYWQQDFGNWHDQLFVTFHQFLITVLFALLIFTKKLKLRDDPVYLLWLYLITIAVSPMIQPRYEYPAYVLLCLQASRYWRFRPRPKVQQPALPELT